MAMKLTAKTKGKPRLSQGLLSAKYTTTITVDYDPEDNLFMLVDSDGSILEKLTRDEMRERDERIWNRFMQAYGGALGRDPAVSARAARGTAKGAKKKGAKKRARLTTKPYSVLRTPDWDLVDQTSEVVTLGGFTAKEKKDAVSYADIVRAFGEPTYRAPLDDIGEKRALEWQVVFNDGTFASIYDSKMSPLYSPDEHGLPDDTTAIPKAVMDRWQKSNRVWGVGGHDKRAGTLVLEVLGKRQPRLIKKMAAGPIPKKAPRARAQAKKAGGLGGYLSRLFG